MGLLQKAIETYDAHVGFVGKYIEGKTVLAPIGHIVTRADIDAVAMSGQDDGAADALRSMLPHTALFPVSSSGLSAAQEAAALLGATHRKGE